jgi:invasion protein IalB
MMIRVASFSLALLAGLAATSLSLRAEQAEVDTLGTFSDWTAHSYNGKDGLVCFVMSSPKKTLPENVKRDPSYVLITHRPKLNVRSEVSAMVGYTLKKESVAVMEVDGAESYELFTAGDGAWAESAAKDRQIVAALKKGREMVLKGVSWRGTKTTDTYSLSGITAAMDKIDEACK